MRDPEQICRLVLVEIPGPEIDPATEKWLRRYPIGGVVLFRRNLRSAHQAAELCHALHELIPDPILSIDQEGGSVVRLLDLPSCPSAMALGAADDLELTEAVAAAMARTLRPLGFNLNFAPVADVNLTAENPVIGPRAFGSFPPQVARHVAAFVRGHQSEGVAACAKHFPGHGDTRVDSHLDLPVLPYHLERLDAVELPPFRAAIEAGCASIMPGHLLVEALDSRPATVSPAILQTLLRRELGFQGAVVTDALNMGGILRDFAHSAGVEALRAGADLLLVLGEQDLQQSMIEALLRAAQDGSLTGERLQEAQDRVEELRRRFPSLPGRPLLQRADERLMERAADKSVTRLGDFMPVRTDEQIVVVARSPVSESHAPVPLAATDREPIAETVVRILGTAFPSCELLTYPAQDPRSAEAQLRDRCRKADRVLWLSASRLRPTDAEAALARELVRSSRSVVHLAVYTPYAALDIPAPALLTYGFRPPSLRALVLALKDPQACTGRPPVELASVPQA